MNDITFRTVVRLKAQGCTWAEVAQQLQLPVAVLEDIPWQDPVRWEKARAFADTLQRQESTSRIIRTLETTLTGTTEAAPQARLANAVARMHTIQKQTTRATRSQAAPVSEALLKKMLANDVDADEDDEDEQLPPLPPLAPLPPLQPLIRSAPVQPTTPVKTPSSTTSKANRLERARYTLFWLIMYALLLLCAVRLIQTVRTPTPTDLTQRVVATHREANIVQPQLDLAAQRPFWHIGETRYL